MSLTPTLLRRALVLSYLAAVLCGTAVRAQEAARPAPPAKTADAKPASPAKPADTKKKLKDYKEVVTADAKSVTGLFTVHRVDDKVYFEIPPAALGQEMLWVTEIEQTPPGQGPMTYGGTAVGDRVVRWTRRNNTVYLRAVDYSVRADEKLAVHQAVADASLEPIIMAFDVEAEGKDKAPVIDVTKLFTSDPPEFSAKRALNAGGVDAARSYVDSCKPFPTNIETKSLLTFSGAGGGPFGPPPGSLSAMVHYSMVLLPKTPMRGRLWDSRVGYFTEDFEDYGRDEHRVLPQRYIARYRLEKKDPAAALSEPVKPIVFYISREVPEKWRPYMKNAVEAWNVAFEQAGFKHAVVARDPPTPQEDPDWDPDDARYSVIRWAPTTFENAMGPHVCDPRSGEVLESHIIVWHNVLKLAEDWYFVQASASDPRARRLPLPDDLMGDIIQYVVTHEVGHTLGLEHNFKASASYTTAQLRDPKFTAANGDEASIMDYGRFNYVAQPGDGARLIPTVGPYDKFAIEWGYTPLPNCRTPDDEKRFLNRIAVRQVLNPQLRFGNSRFEDPTQQTEDLGDDPMAATALGLQNIARIAHWLVPATTTLGGDYDLLTEEYDQLFGQRTGELEHVAAEIGGVEQTDWHSGYGEDVYHPVPAARQRAALRFLLQHAFTTPTEMLRPDVLYRIEPSGAADRVLASQTQLLDSLLSDGRVKRLLDAEALQPSRAYPLMQMVADLQDGLWSELAQPRPRIDLYRRNLQRAYLRTLKAKIAPDASGAPTPDRFSPFAAPAGGTQTDLRPIAVDALRRLSARIAQALPRVTDPTTRLHLADCRTTIARILNPKA